MSQQPALDTVNNVQLQNSTPNRRPEAEDIRNAHGQGRKDIIEARKKWDKDHNISQPSPPEPKDPNGKNKLFIKQGKDVSFGIRG